MCAFWSTITYFSSSVISQTSVPFLQNVGQSSKHIYIQIYLFKILRLFPSFTLHPFKLSCHQLLLFYRYLILTLFTQRLQTSFFCTLLGRISCFLIEILMWKVNYCFYEWSPLLLYENICLFNYSGPTTHLHFYLVFVLEH